MIQLGGGGGGLNFENCLLGYDSLHAFKFQMLIVIYCHRDCLPRCQTKTRECGEDSAVRQESGNRRDVPLRDVGWATCEHFPCLELLLIDVRTLK